MIEAMSPVESAEVALDHPALHEISVKIDAGGAHDLFIVLGADGTIRRRREGGPADAAHDLVIGTAQPELFEEIQALITPQLLRWLRPMRPKAISHGDLRELEVRLKQQDGQELLSRWQVDAEPSGPPAPVIEFAAATVKATNRWYERQKGKQPPRARRPERPGWHLVS